MKCIQEYKHNLRAVIEEEDDIDDEEDDDKISGAEADSSYILTEE